MATETDTKTKTTARARTRPAATAKARPAAGPRPSASRQSTSRGQRENVDRAVSVADQVLEQLETGGQNAIGAVRRFVTSVDDSLPGSDDGPTRGHDVVDAALEMSDRMVELGSDAIRGIVQSAGRNFGTSK